MTTQTLFQISCDAWSQRGRCKAEYRTELGHIGTSQLKAAIRSQGWTKGTDGRDLCPDHDGSDDLYTQALNRILESGLAAPSALQRWLGIRFGEANAMLDLMACHGYVGPQNGSVARTLYIHRCAQCGRHGRRGFTHLLDADKRNITVCSAKAACRSRRPRNPLKDDA